MIAKGHSVTLGQHPPPPRLEPSSSTRAPRASNRDTKCCNFVIFSSTEYDTALYYRASQQLRRRFQQTLYLLWRMQRRAQNRGAARKIWPTFPTTNSDGTTPHEEKNKLPGAVASGGLRPHIKLYCSYHGEQPARLRGNIAAHAGDADEP